MEKEIDQEKAPGTTKSQQWAIFSLLGILSLFCGLVYAIQGPFYPIEAQSKGVSVAMTAFIYGVYELTCFVAAPTAGALMTRIGPVSGLHWGILLTGASTIGLGFISFLTDKTWFIGLSIVFRITQSVGATFRAIAIMSMATYTFHNAVATTLASIESMFGIGMCVGAVAGGALMEISGFKETFIISGALLFLTLPLSMVILRKFVPHAPSDMGHIAPAVTECAGNGQLGGTHHKTITMWTLIRSPSIALSVFALVSAAVCLGVVMGVMEPHLKQFHLTPLLIGLMFLYPSLAYVIASPTLGYVYDKLRKPVSLFLVQYVAPLLLIVAFSVIGPAPFLPVGASTWLTAIGLILLGTGVSSAFVSSFLIAIRDGKKLGSTDDELKVHELISGIWRGAIALGLFGGPSIAGLLYDDIGFPNECLLIIGLQIIHILLISAYGCCKRSSI